MCRRLRAYTSCLRRQFTPVASRCTGGFEPEVRTLAASGLPSIAPERMRAVPREQPHVVQRQQRGHALAHRRERAQVEVAAVQVVPLHDVRDGAEPVDEARGAGKVEVLDAAQLAGQRAGVRGQAKRSAGGAEAAIREPPGEPPQRRLQRGVAAEPKRQPVIVRQHDDVRIAALLAPHDVPHPMPSGRVPAHEPAGDGGGAPAFINGADLCDREPARGGDARHAAFAGVLMPPSIRAIAAGTRRESSPGRSRGARRAARCRAGRCRVGWCTRS